MSDLFNFIWLFQWALYIFMTMIFLFYITLKCVLQQRNYAIKKMINRTNSGLLNLQENNV